jgi:hypothetical protein
MLLWELIFERKPYLDMNYIEVEEFVTKGGREKIQFDFVSPEINNIQKGLEKIIKEGKYCNLLCISFVLN